MSEMIKKKLESKDKVIRELDHLIKQNRDADNDLESLKSEYLVITTTNSQLTGETEMQKSNYLKMKEHLRIDIDSLKSQLSNIES